MKKTAMQELLEFIEKNDTGYPTDATWVIDYIKGNILIEKEKQQIIKARDFGRWSSDVRLNFLTGEDYYKQTFENEKNIN